MAAVYQDFMIFSFTPGENIVLGDKKDTNKNRRLRRSPALFTGRWERRFFLSL